MTSDKRGGYDHGTELAARFNEAIQKEFEGDPNGISVLGCIIASTSVLVAYGKDVPDKQWKRAMLDKIWDQLMLEWGLGR